MDFAVILIATIVGCFALRNPLKALPVAFYAAAIAIDVVYVYGVFFGLPRAIWSPLFVLIQKCELSLALFVVVMFIGCLNRGGRAYHWLKPVRSELSIVAWFLSLGHMAVYLESYLPRLLGGGEIGGNVMGAFVLAVVLLVLLVVARRDLLRLREAADVHGLVEEGAEAGLPVFRAGVRAPAADASALGPARRPRRPGLGGRVLGGVRRLRPLPRGPRLGGQARRGCRVRVQRPDSRHLRRTGNGIVGQSDRIEERSAVAGRSLR